MHSARPARIALTVVGVYIAVMAASSRIGRVLVEQQAVAAGGAPSTRVMVAPVPLSPTTRNVVRDVGLTYEIGTFTWSLNPRYEPSGVRIATLRDTTPGELADATSTPDVKNFLTWSRFPFREVRDGADSIVVRFDDARYASRGLRSFASVTVVRPRLAR